MKRVLRFPASLWLAAGLVFLLFCGGVVSLGLQGWQSRRASQIAAQEMTGGNVSDGKTAISRAGCGACHRIPGIERAEGQVGPPLDKVAVRAFIAGRLVNTPANMTAWLRHPQAIEPGNGMPDPPISDQEARDIAAYLYTLD